MELINLSMDASVVTPLTVSHSLTALFIGGFQENKRNIKTLICEKPIEERRPFVTLSLLNKRTSFGVYLKWTKTSLLYITQMIYFLDI